MDIEDRRTGGTVSWVIAITVLVGIAGAQIYQIALATTAAPCRCPHGRCATAGWNATATLARTRKAT